MKIKTKSISISVPLQRCELLLSFCLQMARVNRSRINVVFMPWIMLFIIKHWRLTLWLTAGWQSSRRTPKAFGLPVFLAFFMMLMPQSALLSSGCTHTSTHGHIFTIFDTYIHARKKNTYWHRNGLTSPSCCHYQIFNNGLKVYRSCRWQLHQTHTQEFWFLLNKSVYDVLCTKILGQIKTDFYRLSLA